jgi:PAS domain S-box-containing protein
MDWYELARTTNWTPKFVTEDELYPPQMSGDFGMSLPAWETYDEPYKQTYPEYVKVQREKDAGAYSVKAALERSRIFENADPGWKSVMKSHYGAIARGEYAAASGEARMMRFSKAPGMRNMSTLGCMDEIRHAQMQLFFPHEHVSKDRQMDWAFKAYDTNEWAMIAARHFFDDIILTRDAISVSIMLSSAKGIELAPDDSTEVRRQKFARIILDAMYQFLGLLDVDGTVLEINHSALEGAGLRLDDVVGKPFWEARWWAVSADSRNRVRSMVEQARNGEFVRCDIEIFGEQHGEKTIIVDFSLTPIRDSMGRVAFLLPEGRNITEKIAIEAELTRKNSELQLALERLRQIDGFRTKFFANVSHELRTPLALIIGPVDQLLKESAPSGMRERAKLEMIRKNAQSLLQQVNDLLDLARIDAQQMPLAYVCADVAGIFKDIASDFHSLSEERGIALVTSAPAELYGDIDLAKFVRVISNLLSNAFKFTPKGGQIQCSIDKSGDSHFMIRVQDTGPGIPAHLKEQIFQRFAQGLDMHSGTGSGLGLNIVKEFVELHQGVVTVQNAPRGGAIFVVEMPIRAPTGAYVQEGHQSSLPLTPLAAVNISPLRELPTVELQIHADAPSILVVEDNPDLRHFLHEILSPDYNVRLADNGKSALISVLSDPPDLVITDLMMPEFDGESFIRALRKQKRLANLPVLVLSARADDAIRESFLEQLVQDYLTKPFSPQELRARAKNLINVKRTVDLLRKELNSQASDIGELTSELVASRKSLQDGLLALQVSERRWLGLYNNSAVGIALADREGRILQANPALQKMLGYTQESIVGVSFIEITEASQRASTVFSVQGLLDGSISDYHVQKRYERRDGSYLWANVSASLIPAVGSDAPRLAVIVEDITSRKQAETALSHTQAELARTQRFTAMGELAASIAHEVNQPLSAIRIDSLAALRWMEREVPDFGEVTAALSRVNNAAALAADVIVRIREFLRKGDLTRTQVPVAPMLASLLRMINPTVTELSVHLDCRLEPQRLHVEADPIQLQQVLLNLFMNALDALRDVPLPDRRLIVTVGIDETKGVLFFVEDNGPGVSADIEKEMFHPLFSTKPCGLGMGLAISRSIVEAHGGLLEYRRVPGGGACFTFNIPPPVPTDESSF